jgi:hypothetical protein
MTGLVGRSTPSEERFYSTYVISDNDGDPFDPDTEEEFAEGFTVGGDRQT